MKYTIALLALIPTVLAHGFIHVMTVQGKPYKGNQPGGDNPKSAIRQIQNTEPLYGATNPDLSCGRKSTVASIAAEAQPGDKVTFDWRGGDDLSEWPHEHGPLITYMANCGDAGCEKFKSSKAKWFKIKAEDFRADGQWKQVDLKEHKVATAVIPPTLAPGNYLIRHEIIGLHIATEPDGGAEFYPSCAQIRVGGSQTGVPTAKELVTFPGGYSDDDAGIYVDIFQSNLKYKMPGPPIAKLASVGGGGNAPAAPGVPSPVSSEAAKPASSSVTPRMSSSAASPPLATASPQKPPKGSSSCKLKKKRAVVPAPVIKRESFEKHRNAHVHSRVMARLYK